MENVQYPSVVVKSIKFKNGQKIEFNDNDIVLLVGATGVWTPTLVGIALLFGIGNAFDSVVSLAAYAFLLKKERINLLRVE